MSRLLAIMLIITYPLWWAFFTIDCKIGFTNQTGARVINKIIKAEWTGKTILSISKDGYEDED